MDKAYDHLKFEDQIAKNWEDSGAYKPGETGEPFSIILPPPNANDPLHVGHAMYVVEDILVRYHRMKGDATLWLPGTDHAGIETQFVFEKKLAKEGKSRFDFDRETLYQKIWDYVQENSGVAVKQLKRLGFSLDWSRFKFTLDPEIVKQVMQTFEKLHKDNLVYRGERLVNYCVKCGTGYSDLEVDYEERVDPLFYVKYKLVGSEEYIVVATTRPEPIFADTHLAIHPDNPKTAHLKGKRVINPLTRVEMMIIEDEMVEPEFGTGIVKLTPAHDAADWDAAKRHGLPIIKAIGTNGRITETGGPLAGLKVAEARKRATEILQEQGAIERIDEKYTHRVGVCYRCKSVIEPLPLPQFFIKVRGLADAALVALDNGETKVLGAGREKILRDWLANLKDWNISRQVIWGIRMPIWYNVSGQDEKVSVTVVDLEGKIRNGTIGQLMTEGMTFEQISSGLQKVIVPISNDGQDVPYAVATTTPKENGLWIQETDTFDTWFSSGQWPVVTLQGADFERFYPTTVMETGYDILPFWVMRMMMMGIYLTGKSPFKYVYLHGLIRDEKGQKMSKSKGNVINPLDMVEKYGADALRMALVMSSTPGQDKAVGEGQIRGMRNLANKIWNAARFVQMLDEVKQAEADRNQEFLQRLDSTITETTRMLDELRIGQAAEFAYNEFWHWFCDEAIEQAKLGEISKQTIFHGLIVFLRLLHPFVPFVTEAIWTELKELRKTPEEMLIVAPWPKVKAN